jgi:Exostosin family
MAILTLALGVTLVLEMLFHGFSLSTLPALPYQSTTLFVGESRKAVLIDELERLDYRYYIYSDSNISQDKPSSIAPLYYRRYGYEAEYEQVIHEALKNHGLRIENPDVADLFIIPTPVGKILTSRGLSYDEAFSSLVSNPIFQKHQGNHHVILSLAHVTYAYENRGNVRQLSRWLPTLANVTAVMASDLLATYAMSQSGALAGNDYEEVFSRVKPMAHHSLSVGLGEVSPDFPITPASLTRFKNSTYFIFYQTRLEPSMFGSTRFRHAPIVNVSLASLPRSSIGIGDITKEEWVTHFKDSKFCLAIRGDTPQSHSLLRSVRAGCLPVVISDHYPWYAPCLKSSMQIEDYSIMIPEAEFMRDPLHELLKLNDISDTVIEGKIANLSLAQRVLLPDHPESLFIPALLKEAMKAMEYKSDVYF